MRVIKQVRAAISVKVDSSTRGGTPPRRDSLGSGAPAIEQSNPRAHLTLAALLTVALAIAAYLLLAAGSATPRAAADTCPNAAFRTGPSANLPDCRAYEQVSPVNKGGYDAPPDNYDFLSPTWLSTRSSTSGDAMVYAAQGVPGASAGNFENYYRATRGATGWSTESITPPVQNSAGAHVEPFAALAFTPDLAKGVLTEPGALTPDAPPGQNNMYVGDLISGTYQAVTNVAPPHSPPDTFLARPLFGDASADLSHVVFSENDYLTPDAPSGATVDSLYDWANGRLSLVSTAPDGTPMVEGGEPGAGRPDIISGCGFACGGFTGTNETHAVSADGLRIFFTGNADRQVYVRENATQTFEVSASHGPDATGSQPALFWAASSDGSHVFFTSAAELTPDANTGGARQGTDLYRYDTASHALTDLTPDSNLADADGAAVQGVLGTSDDGSYVYFVANGDLAGGATSGQPNLYVSANGGAPTFVATLAGGDQADWTPTPLQKTAALTPDGTHLAFTSTAQLTGYDNTDANTGSPDAEVYLYDATSAHLVCASCRPSGQLPVGSSTVSIAASENYAHRSLSSDGSRLFFDSYDAILPQDTNGPESFFGFFTVASRRDVYEYAGGQVHLISDGSGENDSYFLDASPSGNDVFIATRDQLLRRDDDVNMDVYDARIDGGFPFAPPPEPCGGDNCKPPPAGSPTDQTPGSAAFSGPGNEGEDQTPGSSALSGPGKKGKVHTPAATSKKKCTKHKQKCRCKKHKQRCRETSGARSANTTRGGSK